MRRNATLLLAVLVASLALVVAGCGGDDDNENNEAATSTPTATTPAASADLNVEMGEFYFKPKDLTATAGKVQITAPNVGKVLHELIVIRTDAAPDSFKATKGRVDEETLGGGAKVVGEIADVAAGETKSKSFDLPAGKYVMICNVKGHYEGGMYGTITAE